LRFAEAELRMMRPERARLLTSFLGGLPDTAAARLAKAVEVDRLNGGKVLPHDLILDALRPAMRRALTPERTPSPIRLFCQPFEDLLTSEPRKDKQKGRVARASVDIVWTWLSETLIPEQTAQFKSAVTSAVLGYKPDDAKALTAEFYEQASQAIASALSSDKGRKAARARFVSDAIVEDSREMGLLLAAAPEILELQEKMPRPLAALTDDYVWMLRNIYDALIARSPDSAPYVAVVAMNRLARPWEALKLPLMISRQTQDTLISSTDMGLVGDLDVNTAYIRATKPQKFDADDLLRRVARFAEVSLGLVKEVEMRRDGKWGQRLMKDRKDIATIMDGFMEKAPKEIMAALPTQKSGSFAGGPRSPDVSRPSDPEKSDRALGFARLIVGCKPFAAAACFGAKLKDASDEICLALKSYNEDILKELRSPEGPRRANAEQYFNLAAELTSLLYSAEEGEFLRRRGRAALSSAVAA
jgi:hypothetical protein